MKPFLLGLCVLGLTVGTNGQESNRAVYVRSAAMLLTASQVHPEVRTRVLPSGFNETYSVVLAKGVEIRIGSAVLTADEAEYALSAVATDKPTDIQLRGNIRLNGTLRVGLAFGLVLRCRLGRSRFTRTAMPCAALEQHPVNSR